MFVMCDECGKDVEVTWDELAPHELVHSDQCALCSECEVKHLGLDDSESADDAEIDDELDSDGDSNEDW